MSGSWLNIRRTRACALCWQPPIAGPDTLEKARVEAQRAQDLRRTN